MKKMKTYIANYTDGRGNSWDLYFKVNNYREALKEGRAAARREMCGCKFEGVHLKK